MSSASAAAIVIGAFLAGGLALWLVGERGRVIRAFTRRGFRATGIRGVLGLRALHMYVYVRWTRHYVRLAKLMLPLLGSRGVLRVTRGFHGKVLRPEHAKAIVNVQRPVTMHGTERIIPYATARDLVLAAPPDIVAYECACRAASPNPCQPTQVCMIFGQPFVDFVLEHHPASRRLTQAEALELLEAEHARGHVHAAWFKDAMLNRFYAICNCCKCCCTALRVAERYGTPLVASSGYVAVADQDRCTACGACERACPFDAVRVNGRALVSWEKCMGCGVCAGRCPTGGVTVLRDPRKGDPLDAHALCSADPLREASAAARPRTVLG
jgi:ferredoxin